MNGEKCFLGFLTNVMHYPMTLKGLGDWVLETPIAIALGRKLFWHPLFPGILSGFGTQSCETPASSGCNNRSADPFA